MAFWDEIGRALRGVWDAMSQGSESPPEPVETDADEIQYESPEEFEQSGFGQMRTEPEMPGGAWAYEPYMGPYPDDWDENDIQYWDRVMDGQIFENDDQYDDAQMAFQDGYMTMGLSKDEIENYRDELDEILNYTFSPDWEAHREYWEEISPPG